MRAAAGEVGVCGDDLPTRLDFAERAGTQFIVIFWEGVPRARCESFHRSYSYDETVHYDVELVPRRTHVFWNESTCTRIDASVAD